MHAMPAFRQGCGAPAYCAAENRERVLNFADDSRVFVLP
jgi:hypothetical protein